MANVLSEEKQKQIEALGRLGWSLRRIEEATGVRRETAGAYLKAAGIPVRERGGRPGVWAPKTTTPPGGFSDPGAPSAPRRAPNPRASEPDPALIAQGR